ncbi:SCP domain-containing protein [Caenorhabditis elegans]|uniref:SCP domain-containing protein n=1 Tax=Caenorhabditis elegans TaxID=6239 RepID=O16575_CAEEL|nr:SCP domain-containing protein [Caenorhabditis elegans]CCD64920.1 SCP domain-containing protein [Caenorhabditis elegans]|eukprot:NP_494496.1 SCP-Like extracellular protein [Caenorhabditis elegans]
MRALILLAVVASVSVYGQFSKAGQKAIVDAHNTLRSSIAKGTYVANKTRKEPGSNILKMKWDPTIAKSAQAYANTCPTGHGKSKYGENLYWRWSGAVIKSIDDYGVRASGAWASEFQKYGWKTNKLDSALFKTGIGHATQMAWASTGSIGCGVKNCGMDKNKMYKVAVVCQYSARGNMINNNIYTAGKTCSACPAKTKCEKATGLCV